MSKFGLNLWKEANATLHMSSANYYPEKITLILVQWLLKNKERTQLQLLVQNFSGGIRIAYLYTADGLRHIAAYDEQGRQGRRNFAAIATAAESGEDVTEAVLLQLLPHRRCAVQHAHPLA